MISNTNSPDSNGITRYDAAGQLYIYNLATKSLSDASATYELKISAPNINTVMTQFGTKAK